MFGLVINIYTYSKLLLSFPPPSELAFLFLVCLSFIFCLDTVPIDSMLLFHIMISSYDNLFLLLSDFICLFSSHLLFFSFLFYSILFYFLFSSCSLISFYYLLFPSLFFSFFLFFFFSIPISPLLFCFSSFFLFLSFLLLFSCFLSSSSFFHFFLTTPPLHDSNIFFIHM